MKVSLKMTLRWPNYEDEHVTQGELNACAGLFHEVPRLVPRAVRLGRERFTLESMSWREGRPCHRGGCWTAVPPQSFVVDRPFLFLIEHVATKNVLFLGRYVSP
jgi:hypothetical protein